MKKIHKFKTTYRDYINQDCLIESVIIPEHLYNGLVRSLSWKIEYQSRVEKALNYLVGLDSLDSEQLYNLENILKGEL